MRNALSKQDFKEGTQDINSKASTIPEDLVALISKAESNIPEVLSIIEKTDKSGSSIQKTISEVIRQLSVDDKSSRSSNITEDIAKESMQLSLRWAKRCRSSFKSDGASLFGIIQGGVFNNLREDSLGELMEINFEGYAIGGLSVGEPKEEMDKVVDHIAPKMPEEKPRYLMGCLLYTSPSPRD